MVKRNSIEVQGTSISNLSQSEGDYISLTDMVRNFDGGSALIEQWLKNKDTVLFLGVWERINNPAFNSLEFEGIKNEAGRNSFFLSAKKWIQLTGAKGLIASAGRYGGTYAHSDIALEFGSWLSPEFKLYLIKEFQRLKEDENRRLSLAWNLNRTLSKLNYRIHTDAIKLHLIPAEVTAAQAAVTYANEADLLNVALFGTFEELRAAFAAAGWTEADPLGIESAWHMACAFVLNRPYPRAPFSTLYRFGRGQDVGFQRAIGDSPRKRHHVRFWAKSLAEAEAGVDTAGFWLNTDRPDAEQKVLWIGAATKDTGFSLTRLTFQITHATASDTNAERSFVVDELKNAGAIGDAALYQTGDRLITDHINHYITDGEIAVAELRP